MELDVDTESLVCRLPEKSAVPDTQSLRQKFIPTKVGRAQQCTSFSKL